MLGITAHSRTRLFLTSSVAALLAVGTPAAAGAQEPLGVTAAFDNSRFISATSPLDLHLSRPLNAEEERVAIFLGTLDLSALYQRTGAQLRYHARGTRLPAGESELIVYAVARTGEWNEIGRVPVRLLTAAGFEKTSITPKLAVSNKGQVLEGHAPDANRPPRPAFQDFSLNLGLQSEQVRGGWALRTQSNMLGVSNRQEALRFGERQDEAPRLDLADYLVTLQHGGTTLTAGNLAFGSERHIANSFEARGLSARFHFGPVASLSLAGMSGSRLVGWTNPLGIAQPKHRLLGGTLGLDLVPHRPGLVQLEVSALNGDALPQAGFNRGAITNAEQSRSAGVRVNASDPSQRLHLDAGFARTRFTNPADPLLAQGATLVAVQPETRNAHYIDLSWDALRSIRLSPTLPANLAFTVRHERVDPLYRSVASPQTRADLLQNGVQATASVGALSAQLVLNRGHDNLDEIATILTTLTRSAAFNLALPLNAVLGPTRTWLPMITWGLARIHQFGDSVPTLGGFTPTFVPDQVSLSHNVMVAWQAARWRVLYQLSRSSQDNRQEGRENADLVNTAHTLSLGVTPLPVLDVAVDGGLEKADNREFAQHNTTQRLATLLTWRFTARNAVIAGVSHTSVSDDPRTFTQSATDLRLELSQRFTLFRARLDRGPAQVFVRYARQFGDRLVPPGAGDTRRNWSLNTGLTLSVF